MQRVLMVAALSALFIIPALAQSLPRKLGDFGHWTAAVHREGGQRLCYAFTRATRMSHPRSEVLLLVTHRSRARNEVALSSGYIYPRRARVTVSVGRTTLPFQAEGSAAYAANGPAALAAFRRGSEAIARGPRRAGQQGTVTDVFSLRGFTAAYNAISRECPPPRRNRR